MDNIVIGIRLDRKFEGQIVVKIRRQRLQKTRHLEKNFFVVGDSVISHCSGALVAVW